MRSRARGLYETACAPIAGADSGRQQPARHRTLVRQHGLSRADVVAVKVERHPVAPAFFALDEIPHLNIHLVDGLSFLERAEPCSCDVVIVDAYGADDLAGGFADRKFFANIRAVLRPGRAMGSSAEARISRWPHEVPEVTRLIARRRPTILPWTCPRPFSRPAI